MAEAAVRGTSRGRSLLVGVLLGAVAGLLAGQALRRGPGRPWEGGRTRTWLCGATRAQTDDETIDSVHGSGAGAASQVAGRCTVSSSVRRVIQTARLHVLPVRCFMAAISYLFI